MRQNLHNTHSNTTTDFWGTYPLMLLEINSNFIRQRRKFQNSQMTPNSNTKIKPLVLEVIALPGCNTALVGSCLPMKMGPTGYPGTVVNNPGE
jgi:hypothetical protein